MAFKNCDNFPATTAKITVECRLQSGVVKGQKVAIVPYDHPVSEYNGCQCLTGVVTEVHDNWFATENANYSTGF